jgi:hypothetical protein
MPYSFYTLHCAQNLLLNWSKLRENSPRDRISRPMKTLDAVLRLSPAFHAHFRVAMATHVIARYEFDCLEMHTEHFLTSYEYCNLIG